MSQRRSPVPSSNFVTVSGELGQIPNWTGERLEIGHVQDLKRAGVIKSSSEPQLKKVMEGDHTNGIRSGDYLRFTSSHWELGQKGDPSTNGIQHKRYSVGMVEELRDAEVIAKDHSSLGHTATHKRLNEYKKHIEGDLTRGIRVGDYMKMQSTYSDLGQVPCQHERRLEGAVAKERRDAGVPPNKVPPKDIEGDHSQGIKGHQPHFRAMYWDLGCDREWTKTRRKDDVLHMKGNTTDHMLGSLTRNIVPSGFQEVSKKR